MSLKHELLQAAAALRLPSADFRPVGITEWEPIMKRIEAQFVSANYNTVAWWWQHFKRPYCTLILDNYSLTLLEQLIPNQETVWFVAADDKFWLFEGKVNAIRQVIEESQYFEFYLVSKKYEWLVGENHHDVLYGVGEQIERKMRNYAADVPGARFYTSTTSPVVK